MGDDELRVLAQEQAALRRVATLVARGTAPQDVFAAVVEEAARLLPVDAAYMGRYEPDGAITCLASWGTGGPRYAVGDRFMVAADNLGTIVFETGRPARVDNFADASGRIDVSVREAGVRSAVATPLMVDGRIWGVLAVGSSAEQPLPADSEARLVSFTELLATAISNAESRAGLARLADEQTALRRVATLVARGTPPEEVFAAVTEEVGRLLQADLASMCRYESDGTLTFVAAWGLAREHFPVGTRLSLGGKNLATMVFDTGRPVRIDHYSEITSGPIGDGARGAGINTSLATPIMVAGRLWGVISAGSILERPLPADTEERLTSFTKLVATAIANAESRAAIAASRARIVAAADETRRRIERGLHDGTQQQLVSLMLELRAAAEREPPEVRELMSQLSRAERRLTAVLDELREISRGIHPAILSRGGLASALNALVRRSPLDVELDLRIDRSLPEPVEVAAYYVVAEALTNAAKHADASVVSVALHALDTTVRLAIRDDGIGGADLGRGSGLVGLGDRVEALGGTLRLTSPPGSGTTLLVEIPLDGQADPGSSES